MLAHRMFGEDGAGAEFLDEDEEQAALRQDLAAALIVPQSVPEEEASSGGPRPTPAKPLCALVQGFSLHAARTVDEDDREGLERLCCYGLRSPFTLERLSRLPDGRVVYQLKRPWPSLGGATQLVLEPLEFLRRLAALIPAPYFNMVRYHGVFANRSRWRSRLPAPPKITLEELVVETAVAANQDQEPSAARPPIAVPLSSQIPRPKTMDAPAKQEVHASESLRPGGAEAAT